MGKVVLLLTSARGGQERNDSDFLLHPFLRSSGCSVGREDDMSVAVLDWHEVCVCLHDTGAGQGLAWSR